VTGVQTCALPIYGSSEANPFSSGRRGTFIKEYNAMELTVHAGEELIVHEKIHG